MLEGNPSNLEHVLSFALMSNVDSLDSVAVDEPNARLRSILGRVYTQGNWQDYKRLGPKLRTLLSLEDRSFIGQPSDLTVITTNYDVIADYVFYQLSLPFRLPFNWRREPNSEQINAASLYPTATDTALLCKLHGSVNWFIGSDPTEPISIEDRVVSGYVQNRENTDQISLPVVHYDKYRLQREPLIVPPAFFKHQPDRRLDPVWFEATRALSQADFVAFIGYSFPPSDTHMKYFLAGALKDNVGIGSITVVDPMAGEIVKRLRAGDSGAQFKRLLNPIDMAWEEERGGLADNFRAVRV
jgi:hypothetical protein